MSDVCLASPSIPASKFTDWQQALKKLFNQDLRFQTLLSIITDQFRHHPDKPNCLSIVLDNRYVSAKTAKLECSTICFDEEWSFLLCEVKNQKCEKDTGRFIQGFKIELEATDMIFEGDIRLHIESTYEMLIEDFIKPLTAQTFC